MSKNNKTVTRPCPAPGCKVRIASHQALCPVHWHRLNIAQKRRITRSWERIQPRGTAYDYRVSRSPEEMKVLIEQHHHLIAFVVAEVWPATPRPNTPEPASALLERSLFEMPVAPAVGMPIVMPGSTWMKYKCLSLWQPWASLIAMGAKRIETRNWGTEYRGPLAIHAAKTLIGVGQLIEQNGGDGLPFPFSEAFRHSGYKQLGDLPTGAIVAVCNLVDCVPTEKIVFYRDENGREDPDRFFGDYTPGRWAWILRDVRELPDPYPLPGQRKLWDIELPMIPPEVPGRPETYPARLRASMSQNAETPR